MVNHPRKNRVFECLPNFHQLGENSHQRFSPTPMPATSQYAAPAGAQIRAALSLILRELGISRAKDVGQKHALLWP
jgi:hypothetical protein